MPRKPKSSDDVPSPTPALSPGLTLKQQKFIDAYLGEANGNARRAAELAGYQANGHSLESIGWENLRKPEIRQAIQRIYEENAMPAAEVVSRLTEQARGAGAYIENLTKYGAAVDVESLIKDGKGHLIKGVKFTAKGQPIIEFYDAQAALIQLGRLHRLFDEKETSVNVTISPAEARQTMTDIMQEAIAAYNALSDEQKAELARKAQPMDAQFLPDRSAEVEE